MKINAITNVDNTLNRVSFKRGVETNYGLPAPSPKDNIVEGGLLTGFVGTVAPVINQIKTRANAIEKNMYNSKIDYYA